MTDERTGSRLPGDTSDTTSVSVGGGAGDSTDAEIGDEMADQVIAHEAMAQSSFGGRIRGDEGAIGRAIGSGSTALQGSDVGPGAGAPPSGRVDPAAATFGRGPQEPESPDPAASYESTGTGGDSCSPA